MQKILNNGKEVSGAVFNSMFPNINFVKLTNETENHNDHQFVDGLNIDCNSFNPNGICQSGGIYFIKEKYIHIWIAYNGKLMIYVRKVSIPDDARVYIEAKKFKADKIILGSKELISKDIYLKGVQKNGRLLCFLPIPFRSKELCKAAVNQYSCMIQFVPKDILDDEICMEAVKKDGLTLKYVPLTLKDNNNNICITAVKQNGNALHFVPSNMLNINICIDAVRQTIDAFKYVPIHIKDTILKINPELQYYNEDYIDLIRDQTLCTREIAIDACVKHKGNVVNAIMSICM